MPLSLRRCHSEARERRLDNDFRNDPIITSDRSDFLQADFMIVRYAFCDLRIDSHLEGDDPAIHRFAASLLARLRLCRTKPEYYPTS